MNFLSRIVRFLFWVLVVSWSVALLRRLIGWMLRGAQSQSAAAQPFEAQGRPGAESGPEQAARGRQLHRDPVCGMHISEEISFPLREAGETLHFCSLECRDRYAGTLRRAANG
jgi:YHS domain-containing protein